jgi:hypothetical protein
MGVISRARLRSEPRSEHSTPPSRRTTRANTHDTCASRRRDSFYHVITSRRRVTDAGRSRWRWRPRGGGVEASALDAASPWLAWMCSIRRTRNGASVRARGQRAFAAPVPSHPKQPSPSPGPNVSAAHGRALGPPGSPPLPPLRQSAYPVCVGRRGTAWGYMGPGARPGPWHAPFAPGPSRIREVGNLIAPARPCCALRVIYASPRRRRPGLAARSALVTRWRQPACSSVAETLPTAGCRPGLALRRRPSAEVEDVWVRRVGGGRPWAGMRLTRDGRTVQQQDLPMSRQFGSSEARGALSRPGGAQTSLQVMW